MSEPLYFTRIFSDSGEDITFDVLGIAAPETSDPLVLFITAEEEYEQTNNRRPNFKQLCNYLGLSK